MLVRLLDFDLFKLCIQYSNAYEQIINTLWVVPFWILKCCTEYEFELQMQSYKSLKFHFFLFSCEASHITKMWALEILLICAQYRTENSSQNFNRNPICPILLRSKKFAVLYFCHLFKETKKFQASYFFLWRLEVISFAVQISKQTKKWSCLF